MTDHGTPALSRRDALRLLAVTAGGGLLMSREAFAQRSGSPAGAAGLIGGAEVCAIVPETTAGPFYFDPGLVRRDITERREGVPTLLRLQVVDAGCAPIPNARVDVWHCDARGVYSNYPGQGDDPAHPVTAVGETYLRGTQFADDRGVVEFETIYPGWYPGRTPHIHLKVFLDRRTALTGQIFFPDAASEAVYASHPAYRRPTDRGRIGNSQDGIARRAGRAAFASVSRASPGYLVSMIVGVDPAA